MNLKPIDELIVKYQDTAFTAAALERELEDDEAERRAMSLVTRVYAQVADELRSARFAVKPPRRSNLWNQLFR